MSLHEEPLNHNRDSGPVTHVNPLVHVGRPNIGNVETLISRIRTICERRWLSNDGPLAQEFEQRVAKIANVKHCIAMCNGTIALEIAIKAAGLSGEVIVPAYTFVATAHALQWQGITPVFCDIDPINHTIDPDQVERLITPRTTGIIGVHMWGLGCETERLADIANRFRLKLMFDAAHAFGCTRNGRPIGGFGLAEIFSFHATKFVNAAEGGAVVTNDDELAAKMRLMRNFGFAGYDHVIYLGTNGKMNELSAAMGLTSLESMDQFIEVNRRNYHLYCELLRDLPGIEIIRYPDTDRNNFQYIVLDVSKTDCPVTRDQLIQCLHSQNILARRYFFPGVHHMEPYKTLYPNAHLNLSVTEDVVKKVVVLPTGTAICEKEIERVANVIRRALTTSQADALRFCRDLPPGGTFSDPII